MPDVQESVAGEALAVAPLLMKEARHQVQMRLIKLVSVFGLAENGLAGATARARSPICTSASSPASSMDFSEPESSDSGSMASIAAWLTIREDDYQMVLAIVNVIGNSLLATSLRDT